MSDTDKKEVNSILNCCRNGNADYLRILLNSMNITELEQNYFYDNTAMYIAIDHGYENIVRLLIKYGFDINQLDFNNFSPLHRAIYTRTKQNLSIIQQLLTAGANANLKGENDATLLHYTCWNGYYEVCKLLIRAGAMVNAKDYFGYTPIHMAIAKRNKDIARLLINAGADVNVTDQIGSSLLHQAIETKNIEIFKMILSAGANVNVTDRYGETPLHLAVEKNNNDIIKLLIDAGADENIRNMYGRTPFGKGKTTNNSKLYSNKLARGVTTIASR